MYLGISSGTFDEMRATGQVDMMKQMPPLATEIPDTAGGLADVSAWLNGLTVQ